MVQGHSGSSEKGTDVICGAVSALVLTFLGGVEKTLSGVVEGEVGVGVCNVKVSVPGHHEESLRVISKVFLYGFERLASTHPTFLTVEGI